MKQTTNLIVIVSTLLTIGAIIPPQATANETSQLQYEMVVVGNQSFGDLVSKGDYQTAINRIGRRYRDYPYASATNLCTAFSMLNKFEQAEIHCNEAIKLANKSSVPAPKGWKGINQMTAQQAQAYSNRGVMRVMSGNEIGAEEDFHVAIERNANLHAPARNLARVQLEHSGQIMANVSR